MFAAEQSLKNVFSTSETYGLHVPTLMSDEYLSGFFGRIAILNYYRNIRDLHGYLARKTHQENARDTPILMCLSDLLKVDAIQLWKNHTVYPVKSKNNDEDEILNKLRVSHSSARNKKILCKFMPPLFCPACVEDDIKKLGYTYWRTKHQTLESKCCQKHLNQKLYTATDNHRFYFSPSWNLHNGNYLVN